MEYSPLFKHVASLAVQEMRWITASSITNCASILSNILQNYMKFYLQTSRGKERTSRGKAMQGKNTEHWGTILFILAENEYNCIKPIPQ